MNQSLLIFLGAGVGGVLRYWITNITHLFVSREFPYGTFLVNVSGCFLMGLIFILTLERLDAATSYVRALMLIGLLGGYTTFSSFSIETINLFENGNMLSALTNVFLSTTMCIAATWLGVVTARSL